METKGGTERQEYEIALKFDRTAPGGGAEALCRLENGRALLEWRFHLTVYSEKQITKILIPSDGEETIRSRKTAEESVRLRLTDMGDNPVLECIQFLREEEPLRSILPQPAVWQGVSNPCLYKMEAVLADREGNCLDRIRAFLPLRQVECGSGEAGEEVFLNGEPFEKRMVRYTLPETGNPVQWQRTILEDLGILQKLGANCLLLDVFRGGPQNEVLCNGEICGRLQAGESLSGLQPGQANTFVQLCDRMGFLIFTARRDSGSPGFSGTGEEAPVFRGIGNSFFVPGREAPTPLFFKYRAQWSREPFVYLVPESLKRLNDGNYSVYCYSNCSKVALYSDGRLFEFRAGELTFPFYGIPCAKPTVMLTAEGEGCAHSLSIHKTFTKQSPNDDIFPIE